MTSDFSCETSRALRRAWLVLAVAFIVFMLLVTTSAITLYSIRRNAMRDQVARLEASAEVLLQAKNELLFRQVSRNFPVREGDTIRTQRGVQATLTFFDGSALYLADETVVQVRQMRASRFVAQEKRIALTQQHGWSRLMAPPLTDYGSGQYEMTLDTMEIRAESHRDSSLEVSFEMPPIPQAAPAGLVAPREARVAVRSGTASVSSAGQQVRVSAGHKVAMRGGKLPTQASLLPLMYIRNGDFSELIPMPPSNTLWPRSWIPRTDQGGDGGAVDGVTEVLQREIDGRATPVIAFSRHGATDNALTGIGQELDLPLSHFRSLRLRVDVQVLYHSLAGGGIKDSEYPVVIKLTYRDRQNRPVSWYRGFYLHNEDRLPISHGIKVKPGEWYMFEQDLLRLTAIPNAADVATPEPVYLETLDIYAEGHDFDAFVAAVSIEGD